jgi:hypothetical protein
VPAPVCVVVLPDLGGVVLVLPVEACCVLDDEADDEADDEPDEDALVELLLFVLLLAAAELFVEGSGGGGASCTLDDDAEDDEADEEDDEEGEQEGDEDAEDDEAGGLPALFCRSMLCCSVCENGLVFAAAAMAALVEVLLAEPSSEPICERSDIGNPGNPSNGVFGQPRRRSGGSDALGAHPQNARGVFVGVALVASRHGFRLGRFATRLQHFI